VAVFDDTQPQQPLTLVRAGSPGAAEAVPGPPPLQAELDAFLDAVERGAALAVDGHSGLGVIRTLTALQRSLDRGGARVEIAELEG
jgi:predicted dehydrogenase